MAEMLKREQFSDGNVESSIDFCLFVNRRSDVGFHLFQSKNATNHLKV